MLHQKPGVFIAGHTVRKLLRQSILLVGKVFLSIILQAVAGLADQQAVASYEPVLVNTINDFELAFYRPDAKQLRRLISMEGVYLSDVGNVVSGAELTKVAEKVRAGRGAWDEKTTPVIRIDTVSHIAPNVRVVRGCELQPTMLYPRYTIEFVLISDSEAWRIVSLTRSPNCREEPRTSSPIHDSR